MEIRKTTKKIFIDLLPLSEFYAKTDNQRVIIDTGEAYVTRSKTERPDWWYVMDENQRSKVRLLVTLSETLAWTIGSIALLNGDIVMSAIGLVGFKVAKGWIMGFARFLHGDL